MASIQSNSDSEQGHPADGDAPTGLQFRSPGDYLVYTLASGFGIGLIPFAPGTFGSLLGVMLWSVLATQISSQLLLACAVLLLVMLSIPICHRAGVIIGKPDPGSVVLDEIVALPVVFVLSSALITPLNFKSLLIGFILFRLFDIAKPWPIRYAERLPGGWGIVADDLIAAIYAAICLTVILHLA